MFDSPSDSWSDDEHSSFGRSESARRRRPYPNGTRAKRFLQVVGEKLNDMREWFFGSDDTDANDVVADASAAAAAADATATARGTSYPTCQSDRATRYYAAAATAPPSVPSPSSIGRTTWKGRTIDSLAFGELRGACRSLNVLVSPDRSVMERRVYDALQRQLAKQEASQKNPSKRRLEEQTLEVILKKKARTGFSVAEYERYRQLMQDNLIEEDANALSRLRSVGAEHTSAQLARSHHTNTGASSIDDDHVVSKATTSGRTQRGVSCLSRSISRSRPSRSNSRNLPVRPPEASSRLPKPPQLSSEAAKRHLAALHSLSSPLISSAGLQSRSIRRRPVSPLRAPATARALPAPAPEPARAATPERPLPRPPHKTQEPLLTPIAPRDQQRPSVVPRQTPVQQSHPSSYAFRPAPVSTTEATSTTVNASKEETSLPASVAEKERAQRPVNECSVCGMGIDDVDHTECEEEDQSSSTLHKPAFSFGAMPPLSSGGPSVSFGGEPAPASSGAGAGSFVAPAPVPETAGLPTFSFGASTAKPKFALGPRGEGASVPKPSGPEAAVSSTAPSAGPTGFKFGPPNEPSSSLTGSSSATTTTTTTTATAASAPSSSTPRCILDILLQQAQSTTPAPAPAPSTTASADAFSFGASSTPAQGAAAVAPTFSFFGNTTNAFPSSAPKATGFGSAAQSSAAFSFRNPSASGSDSSGSSFASPSTSANSGFSSFAAPSTGSLSNAAPAFDGFRSAVSSAFGFAQSDSRRMGFRDSGSAANSEAIAHSSTPVQGAAAASAVSLSKRRRHWQ